MLQDLLRERERGFENDYFNRRDAKLIQKIREHARLQEVAAALAEKLHVDAPILLQRAAGLGLDDDGDRFRVENGEGKRTLLLILCRCDAGKSEGCE